VVEVAEKQHGVVTLAQLRAAGLGEKAIRHRVGRRWLVRMHRGIYRVGPVADPLAAPFAAVLAGGPSAVLSHDAAAILHGLAKGPPRRFDVTITSGHRRPQGVVLHRARLREDERTLREGIPVTTAARTLVDLATRWRRRDLERAVEQAVILGAATEDELREAAEIRRKGAARLRAVLDALTSPSLTRSEAERRLLELIRSADLPRPVTNTRIGRYEVDALWPDHRLVVEVDGYAFHSTRQAFERDRARDAALQVAGHRVLRLTWRQIAGRPHAVVATLAAALGSPSRGSGS
jgi:very-short-patch-repair endonuclease